MWYLINFHEICCVTSSYSITCWLKLSSYSTYDASNTSHLSIYGGKNLVQRIQLGNIIVNKMSPCLDLIFILFNNNLKSDNSFLHMGSRFIQLFMFVTEVTYNLILFSQQSHQHLTVKTKAKVKKDTTTYNTTKFDYFM